MLDGDNPVQNVVLCDDCVYLRIISRYCDTIDDKAGQQEALNFLSARLLVVSHY